MKNTKIAKGLLVCAAIVGLCGIAAAAPAVVDVSLQEGNTLVGQVVDPQGAALEGVPVSLRYQDQQWVATKTGQSGYFAFRGLNGGTYQIASSQGHGVYRVWVPGTAPPAAQQGALLVAGGDVTRGQAYYGAYPSACPPQQSTVRRCLTNPLVIAGAVATAVAVPVAIHNADTTQPVTP